MRARAINSHKASSLFYHPATGELLRADLLQDQRIGDRIVNWIGVVHFGAFGSPILKLVWAVGALAFPLLAVTGITVYFNKRGSKAIKDDVGVMDTDSAEDVPKESEISIPRHVSK